MSELVVSILEEFLGDPKKHNHAKSQIAFDCPACGDDGEGKGNLEVNYDRGVFKCWACWQTNRMSGRIPWLMKRFARPQHLKEYLIIKPEFLEEEDPDKAPVIVKAPKEFKPLTINYGEYDRPFKEAMDYLKGRRVNQAIINRFNIGYADKGPYAGRIILPSYDANGHINYYTGRAFWKSIFPKYRNPDAPKEEIIFNESLVNWDATIYLVEGPFDHIVTPNSIPLLGKFINDKLYQALQEKAQGYVVIVLDEDAYEDAKVLYRKLNTGNLRGRVRLVKLKKNDVAKIHEVLGPKGVLKILKKAKTIPESQL